MIPWIKSHKLLLVMLILLISISSYGILTQKPKEQSSPKEPSKSIVKDKGEAKIPEETTDQKNYRKAKLKLERPYSSVEETQKTQVISQVSEALDTIKKADKVTSIKGSYDNHLAMTEPAMLQTVAIALLVNHYNYQSSDIEVLASDSQDVLQVLIPLTKANSDSVYIIANYNSSVHQVQLVETVGGAIGATFG